uniref:protein mono-ADP-ribosyltransferase PARP14-like isoform X2 n=1 Tax=Pristiophorus japonicus TaxID=55135 RepID=UPI00398F08FE
MANQGASTVLVTGFSHIAKKGLENKLVAYFQSKKKSGGGECDIKITENGDALVTFYKEDVSKSVLERKHTLTINGQSIELSVTQCTGKQTNSEDVQNIFSPVKTDSTCRSEVSHSNVLDESNEPSDLIDSSRICIKLETDEFDPEDFSFYIDCCSDTDSFQVFHTNETSIFIVEFTANIDLNKVVHNINKKTFHGLKLVAEPLPRTCCLRITQFPESIVQDHLELYFEHFLKDDNNVEVHLDRATQSAIMIFRSPEAVERVLSVTHNIKSHTLKIHRYYEGEQLTEFTSEQDRKDAEPSKEDKEDSESLTQRSEDKTKLASCFVTEQCGYQNKYYVLILKNQDLDKEFPNVQLQFDMSQNVVQITGMENDVLKVQIKLFNKGNQITSKIIHLSKHLRIFLTQLDKEGCLTEMFLDSGINAAYSYNEAEDKGVLYAASENSRLKAEEKLKMTFAEVVVPIPENFHLDSTNDFNLLIEETTTSVKRNHQELKDVKEKYLLQHYLESEANSGQSDCVILVGYRIVTEEAKRWIENYMNENCLKELFIEVQPMGVFEYVQRFVNFSDVLPQDVNIDFVKNEQSLGLQIRVSIKNATQTKAIIMDMLKQIKIQSRQLCQPGAVQFFGKNRDLLKKLENPYRCVIYTEDQEGQQTNPALSEKTEIVSTAMFLNKFKISVVKHNLVIHEVDAILHLTNEMLDCSSGLSKTLVDVGGPELQENINRLKGNRQRMKEGAVIPTSPGKLPCLMIFHVMWTKSDTQDVQEALMTKILRALSSINSQFYTSVAIPAFSLGESKSSIRTMVKAIKQYCEEFGNSDPKLTDIRLVSTNEASIKAMKKAVKELIEPEGKHSKMPAVMKLAWRHGNKNSSANTGLELQKEASKPPKISEMQPDTSMPQVDPGNSDDTFETPEGLKVILVKGSIADQKSDVIVNTVSTDMNLSQGPVSSAILKLAGDQLQTNTNKAKGSKTFQAGDVLCVSTLDCELQCHEVYNVICCHWNADKASQAEGLLRTIIQECLKHVQESKYRSISFPAIGTGNMRFPKNIVAQVFFEEIQKFSNANPTSTLKEVKLIIYEKDLAVYSAFVDAMLIAEGIPAHELLNYNGIRNTQPANKTGKDETSMNPDFVTNIRNVTFEVYCRDFSKKDDVLVVEYVENKSNYKVTFKGGKHCIPVRIKGQTNIVKALLKVFQNCSDLQYRSLCIPVPKQLSSGNQFPDIKLFAAGVAESVHQYAETKGTSAMHVIVSDSSPAQISVFQKAMAKFETEKGGIFNTMSKYLGWLGGYQTSEDITEMPQHSVKFEIYSMKEENIQKAWADIQKLATKEHMEKTMAVEIPFEKFTEEDLEEIAECCKSMHVLHRFNRANDSIYLSGCIADICSVQDVIFKVCHNIGKREVSLREEMFIMEKVCWKFRIEDQWETFNPTVNAHLEKAYNGKENEVKLKIEELDSCVIDFQKFTLTDADGKSFRIYRASSGDEFPDTWEIEENKTTTSEVPLKPDSSEYQEVASDFMKTLAINTTCKIDAISRIQNPTLWRLYVAKRNEMNRQRPHQQNEKLLYHGTSPETCSKINADGFNRSYCGLNATFYGNGTYFAQNAQYSAHDTYSKPDATGRKVMYRARVLTGEYCKGEKDLKEPPLKDQQANSRDRYDSVTDKMLSPEVFVVFQDNQAYPEYLITFQNQ